jgi:hypothetical protein
MLGCKEAEAENYRIKSNGSENVQGCQKRSSEKHLEPPEREQVGFK